MGFLLKLEIGQYSALIVINIFLQYTTISVTVIVGKSSLIIPSAYKFALRLAFKAIFYNRILSKDFTRFKYKILLFLLTVNVIIN